MIIAHFRKVSSIIVVTVNNLFEPLLSYLSQTREKQFCLLSCILFSIDGHAREQSKKNGSVPM